MGGSDVLSSTRAENLMVLNEVAGDLGTGIKGAVGMIGRSKNPLPMKKVAKAQQSKAAGSVAAWEAYSIDRAEYVAWREKSRKDGTLNIIVDYGKDSA